MTAQKVYLLSLVIPSITAITVTVVIYIGEMVKPA